MILRFLWGLLSIFFPWLVLLLYDNPGGAIVALIMQATVIGWIPATLWAMRARKESLAKTKVKPQ